MGRKRSSYWDYAEDLKNNRFKCNFCKRDFAGGVSRIRAHLAGEKGHDIVICDQVHPDVQAKAHLEIQGRNKKPKSVPGSNSNNVEENGNILLPSLPSAFINGSNYALFGGRVTQPDSHSSNGGIQPTTIPAESEGISMRVSDIINSYSGAGCPLDGEQDTHPNSHWSNGDELPTTALAVPTTNVGNMEEDPSLGTSNAIMAFNSGSFQSANCALFDEQVTHPNSHSSIGDVLPTTIPAGQTVDINMEEDLPIESVGATFALPGSLGHPVVDVQVTHLHSSNEYVQSTTAVAGQTTNIGNAEGAPSSAISGSSGCPPVGEQVIHHNSHSNNGGVLPTPALAGQTADVRNTEDDPSTVIDEMENRGYPLLTTKLVGQAFQRNVDKIWKILMKDNVLSIGVRGMGGVGKTALVMHIYNRLLENHSSDVCWFIVSQDFSIKNMQNDIAKVINLDLSKVDDVKKSAAKLAQNLKRRKKLLVLILDDVWKFISLQEVGIPVEENVYKLILTTRFSNVCQRMCQENVKVEPLDEEEAWNLFMEKFGHDIPLEVRGIARSIAKECAGLPLGIITVAGSMRGMDIDIHGWRNTLEELKHSKVGLEDMEDEVFGVLKFSYNILKEDLQQCFLYCSLYPEDYKIERDDLIKNLIDEGIIQGMQSRQDEFDKGHVMLNKLENAYLLERVVGYKNQNNHVKMHDLVRDMAIQIAQARHSFMVEAGKGLEDLPDKEKWKEDLVRVSLMYNGLTKIPSNALRGCPKLSTLMLNNNYYLETIPNDFFVHMPGLKVLNLSYTNIEYLPDSVFNLKNLTALVLIKCEKLKHVNSLEKLTALRRLELVHIGIKEIPQGLKMLVNLRHLNLHLETRRIYPSGILPKLSHLQHLEISLPENIYLEYNCFLEVEEVESLKKLETFKCQLSDIHAFNECVRCLKKVRPSNYVLIWGSKAEYDCKEGKVVMLVGCIIREKDPLRDALRGEVALLLPKDTQFLKLREIRHLRSLCDLPSLNMLVDLKKLDIYNCGEISLFDVPSIPLLKSIEVLNLSLLRNPSLLAAPSRPPPGTFSQLKVFNISSCFGIKTLFVPWLLQYLHNLEEIIVEYCGSLVKIIGELSDEEDDEGMDTTRFPLPKLRLMKLRELHNLKSICSSSQLMVCDSIQQIEISNCQMLKRLPLSLPFLNGQLCPPPSLYKIETGEQWWESLEWDHPNSKTVLQSFFVALQSFSCRRQVQASLAHQRRNQR